MQSGKQIDGHDSNLPSTDHTSIIRLIVGGLLDAIREGSEMQTIVRQYR